MQQQRRFHPHDGSSQAERALKALDPGYVSVDERSIKDLLRFAQEYARELKYFNDRNENEQDENWSRFLDDNSLDEIVAYLKDPQKFQDDAQKKARLARPHLTLFLTFLELLQYARSQLNDLTRRHLEFYYREALRLTSRQGTPDQVHVLVELADGQEQFLLPKDSLFQAGQDALGQPVFYRSAEDLVANRGAIEKTRSLFAEKHIVSIREARQNPDILIELFPNNKDVLEEGFQADRAFLAMLMMALGSPVPGSKPEPYPGNRTVDADLLNRLDALLDFVPSVLYMPFSTFRALMKLKEQARADETQWDQVNSTLQKIARKELDDDDLQMAWTEPANFEKNLLTALSRSGFAGFFNELPEVQDIYDLYRRRDREDVIQFIGDSLYTTVEEFSAMMKTVEEIHGRWRQIYEILRAAGRKKKRANPSHQLQPPLIRMYEEDKFNGLIQRTLGTIAYSAIQSVHADSFEDVYAAIIELEDYFRMPAEKFVFIRAVNRKDGASAWEWQQVYGILEEAHAEKVLSDRRKALQEKREKEGFETMILFALGDRAGTLPEKRKFAELDPDRDRDYLTDKLFLEPANFTHVMKIQSRGKNATAEEWSSVYTILELAQRRKSKWEMIPPQIEKWENLYAAPDASQIQVRLLAEGEDSTPRWRTFGEGYAGAARTVPGDIGFAITSPLLALGEGKRTITLTLDFQAENFDKETLGSAIQPPLPFRFLLSTEKEMTPIEAAELKLLDSKTQHALQITLSLGEQAPAVAPLQTGKGIQMPWPVLAILLADLPEADEAGERPVKRYRAFQHLALAKIRLDVKAEGLTQLLLQNNDALLDAKKPFEPFGMSPAAGSSLYFAHPELCSKKLDELTLKIEWLGAPDNLSEYYLGYLESEKREIDPTNNSATSPIKENTDFKMLLRLYDNRLLFDISSIQLFHAEDDPKTTNEVKKTIGASKPIQAVIPQDTITAAGHYPDYERNIQLVTGPQVLDWNRYWKLELLSPDFQHSVYPRVAAACASKIVPGTSENPKPRPYIVNPPYTPKIKRLTVGYSSSLELDLAKGDLDQQADRLCHIEPFGYRDLTAYDSLPYRFLPQFDDEGELLIGIKNLKPPQDLCLLFQMAEGSADPDLEREPVHWSFLDGNAWRSLEEGRLLSDTTNGLLNSGILRLSLPPVRANTLLDPDLYWIRSTIHRNSRCVADIVAIQAQAVLATFEDQGNDPNRLAQPLKAGSITGLVELLPQVKAIHQPYSSFGGKSPEQAGAFYTRVSERLRHKNRALTSWDYEHMVLETFPNIYRVKCLPVGTSEDPHRKDVIQVIVIPDIQGKLPFDPFEPKLPADVLLQIEQYLIRHSPPSTPLMVKNPSYVRLRVRVGVRLRTDTNPGYYKNLLNEELQRFLSPWAYDRSAEIVFGGRINASLIVNFLEERPYVDYVAGINLFTSLAGQEFTLYDEAADTQLEDVSLLDPEAILVSDRYHEIDLIAEEDYEQEFFTGINYMKIGFDFKVG